MIGTLLFYWLYLLSRYLSRRLSEASSKAVPPAVVNGAAVWDGGSVTSRRFNQSQTALLDQWLSPTAGSTGEMKERVKEPSPEKEDSTNPDMDKDPLVVVLHKDSKNGTASKMSEVQSTVKEEESEEGGDGPWHKAEEAPTQEDGRIKVHHKEEDISTEQALRAQQQTSPVQEQTHTEDSIEGSTCSAEEQIPNTKKPQIPAKTTTECWDEYMLSYSDEAHDGASTAEYAFLLPDTQTHKPEAQTGWHFPAGTGLAEEVECPLWDFPAISYYPPKDPAQPFEVIWRVWETVDGSAADAVPALIPFPLTKTSMDFTVMSYNILAQDLLEMNQELYTHCPLEVLDWSYRCSLLLEEIQKWLPDILCLQEVQENHYHEQLHPALSQMGYTCVYKRRTGTKTDGCATCYRSSCFSEAAVTLLEYFRPETELMNRHNVGIVLLLRPLVTQGSEVKEKGPLLCVANTHLLFNPRRGDVKLAQLAVMLAEIDKVIQSCKTRGDHCNVILCGDFNSVPCMPLYQLITTGKLHYQGLPAWMISGQEDLSYKPYCHVLTAPLWPHSLGITDNCQYATVADISESKSHRSGKCQYSHEFMLQLRYCPAACVRPQELELITGVTDNLPDGTTEHQQYRTRFRNTINHQLDLESVYKHILPGSGSPEVTTLHSEMGGTVDYIFYSPKRDQKAGGSFSSEGLKLLGSLSLLSEDVLWSLKGLPNHIFPSDHLSLVAKFQLEY